MSLIIGIHLHDLITSQRPISKYHHIRVSVSEFSVYGLNIIHSLQYITAQGIQVTDKHPYRSKLLVVLYICNAGPITTETLDVAGGRSNSQLGVNIKISSIPLVCPFHVILIMSLSLFGASNGERIFWESYYHLK